MEMFDGGIFNYFVRPQKAMAASLLLDSVFIVFY